MPHVIESAGAECRLGATKFVFTPYGVKRMYHWWQFENEEPRWMCGGTWGPMRDEQKKAPQPA